MFVSLACKCSDIFVFETTHYLHHCHKECQLGTVK